MVSSVAASTPAPPNATPASISAVTAIRTNRRVGRRSSAVAPRLSINRSYTRRTGSHANSSRNVHSWWPPSRRGDGTTMYRTNGSPVRLERRRPARIRLPNDLNLCRAQRGRLRYHLSKRRRRHSCALFASMPSIRTSGWSRWRRTSPNSDCTKVTASPTRSPSTRGRRRRRARASRRSAISSAGPLDGSTRPA